MKKTIIKASLLIFAGFMLGGIEENLRFSIIQHEAKKGDSESQDILNVFDAVGAKIEETFS